MTMEKQIYHSDSDFTFYEKCSGKKLKYMGSYDYMGMRVSFSATDQYPLDPNVPAARIQYRYRGTISILDPRGSGEVLRLQGADADYALKKYRDKHPGEEVEPQKMQAILKVTESIYCNEESAEELAEHIYDECIEMLEKYRDLLADRISLRARANTLTPREAAFLYTDRFLAKQHPQAAEKTRTAMRNTIFGYCKRMENKPMAQFTKREVNKFVSAENVTDTEKNILYHFWNYCLERYYCEGSNPFERPAPKTLSPESQVNKNKVRLSMSLAEREYIFQRLRANPDAYACLVTLGLFCGLPVETALKLTWNKITFDKGEGQVELTDTDLGGNGFTCATHNLTFPMMRQAYEILSAYKKTAEQQEAEDISGQLIVGDSAITKVTLDSYIDNLVAQMAAAEIESAVRPLKSGYAMLVETYRMMIETECGLQNDEGTKRFLEHRPLSGLVTDDHYVDYTGPEAQDRQRIILQRLAPKKNNRVTERQLKDGSAKYTPRSNKECVSLGNKFTLQPGEELYAMADHGFEGQITILEKDL